MIKNIYNVLEIRIKGRYPRKTKKQTNLKEPPYCICVNCF